MEYLDRLSKSIESLENDTEILSKAPELMLTVQELTKEVQKEKKIAEDSLHNLTKIVQDIHKATESVNQLIDRNEKSSEALITTMKDELIRSKRENIEAMESIITTVNNKLSMSENNLYSEITKSTKLVIDRLDAINSNLEEHNNKMLELKVSVKYLTIMSIVGMVIGIISIAVGIFV